jgi:predicted transcriptional regulator
VTEITWTEEEAEKAMKDMAYDLKLRHGSVNDVAELVDLSPSTVRRVLNTGKGSDKTLNAMAELHLSWRKRTDI